MENIADECLKESPLPNQSPVKVVLDLLVLFLDRKSDIPPPHSITDQKIYHYYKEITRNWNQLKFIYQTTLLSLEKTIEYENVTDPFIQAIHFYAIYRSRWENAKPDLIIKDLDHLLPPSYKNQFSSCQPANTFCSFSSTVSAVNGFTI